MITHSETFEQYRHLLFSIAYRMLGSAMEAEDMVQEAYLRYQATPPESIQYPKAFLSQVITRLCLDHLKSAKVQREQYLGPWLPEPVLTVEDEAVSQHESISMALLVLMESLSPIERAVFLLRDVFEYSYPEIAQMVDKTEANCRQYYHRAKQYVVEHRPRFQPSKDEQTRLIGSFMHALGSGDVNGFMALLAEDVAMWGDGGGKASAAIHPLFGKDKVGRFLLGLMKKFPPNVSVQIREINSLPALVMWMDGKLLLVMNFVTGEGRFHQIRTVLNPDKLRHLDQQLNP